MGAVLGTRASAESGLGEMQSDLLNEAAEEAKRAKGAPELKPGDLQFVAHVLWSRIPGQRIRGHTGIVYNAGKLYVGGLIVEAATGKVLAGVPSRSSEAVKAAPKTGHHLLIGGDHVYGLRNDGDFGAMQAFTLDGRLVAENRLPSATVDAGKREQIRAQVAPGGQIGWNKFSYSCPFTIAGDRIYVRSNDDLWCIGRK